ncbi:Pvc16 family protein [Amycolatopsis sp. NPDC098790]|uniref:Pvc16 family protein n=1 Tax=Amycolatopsis sp. NPDC098790 TaxID=3363939 RepID=UPI003808201E
MIAQVDEALCRLLRPRLPSGTQIRLDPPKPAWQTESQVRSVELFLFALRDAVGEGNEGEGKRVARRCALSYLVTARAGAVQDEHALLDAALHAVLDAGQLPAESASPVRMSLAATDPTGLWTSLGMPARAAFVLLVTADAD